MRYDMDAGYETLKQYQKNMKKILILAAVLMSISAMAQTPKNVKYEFTEASELNLTPRIHTTAWIPANTRDSPREKTNR